MVEQSPSLRERLEGKKRRRLTVPILVEDPEPLQAELDTLRRAHAAAALNSQVSPEELADLQAREQSAAQAVADCVVEVEFQALRPADFEHLIAEHTLPDPEQGAVVDSTALLPVLAAHCAVDSSLRDEQWWADLLAEDGTWTQAEKSNLYYSLFSRLHYTIPTGALGKD